MFNLSRVNKEAWKPHLNNATGLYGVMLWPTSLHRHRHLIHRVIAPSLFPVHAKHQSCLKTGHHGDLNYCRVSVGGVPVRLIAVRLFEVRYLTQTQLILIQVRLAAMLCVRLKSLYRQVVWLVVSWNLRQIVQYVPDSKLVHRNYNKS